jgi:CheY-like chemotaxis protein
MNDNITVLVIDDEIVSRYTIEVLLTHEHYSLVFAEGGAQGLEKIAAVRPDVVLLDVMMPDVNGFEVCRRLRAKPSLEKLPIIMMTVWDDPIARQKCLDAGANCVVYKPVNGEELRETIHQLIAAQMRLN